MRSVTYGEVEDYARDGYRIQFSSRVGEIKTLWSGLGNRSGLHSFVYTLLSEKWEKSGARMLKRLKKLDPGTTIIMILTYKNKTRDRGSWHVIRRVSLTGG